MNKTVKTIWITIFTAIILLGSFSISRAALNEQINYQGKLTDTSNVAVADGAYDMVFKLYTVPSGGTDIWNSGNGESWTEAALFTETGTTDYTADHADCGGSGYDKITYTTNTNEGTLAVGQYLWDITKKEAAIIKSVTTTGDGGYICLYDTASAWSDNDDITNRIYVKSGLFSAMLGTVTSLSSVNFYQTLYLGVKIGADAEMKPRKVLGVVPGAFEAKQLGGKTWAVPDTIGSTTPNTGAFTTLAATYSGASTALTVTQSSTGKIASLIGDSITTGIGLEISADGLTTGTAVDISSTSTAGTASDSSYLLKLARSGANSNTAHTAYGIYSTVTNTNVTSGTNIAGYFSASGATTANYGLIVAAGNVGIGTTAPGGKLEVNTNTAWNTASVYPFQFVNLDPQGYEDWGMYVRAGGDSYLDYIFTAADYSGNKVFNIMGSGSVGIGTTDIEAWGTGYKAVEFPKSAILFGTGTTDIHYVSNAYYDGAWKYKTTDEATRYFQSTAGIHSFQVAPSGTIDTALTWTDALTILNSGNVGIGMTSPTSILHIKHDGTQPIETLIIDSADTDLGTSDPISGIVFKNRDASFGQADDNAGLIQVLSATSTGGTARMELSVGGTAAAAGTNVLSILNSGYVGIGTTAPGGLFHIKAPAFSATGGTITYSGGYTIHTFTTSGTFTPANTGNVEYLVVAGGGGGGDGDGGTFGGGGGAGGFLTSTISVTAQAYSITVGAGGTAAPNGNTTAGGDGGNSIFSTITATGGGGGGTSVGSYKNGRNGGSGGGVAWAGTVAGTGIGGQGFAGGTYNVGGSGGGGGGSSATPAAGAGGAGTASSISGASVTYATGGGSGVDGASTANSGNGGNSEVTSRNAQAGGSGIVIIKYPTSASDALVVTSAGLVGLGTASPGAQLDLSTDNARKLTTTTWSTGSDVRIKTNIQSISDALEIISRIRPVKFHYTPEFLAEHPSVNDTDYYNFVAQEYQQVFPNSVTETDGLLYLNSSNMIPYAIAGIQEQQKQIEELKVQLNGSGQIVNLSTDQLKSGLAELGLVVSENGVLEIQKIKADTGHFKQFEMEDKTTGKIYCTWIENGEWVKVVGECESNNNQLQNNLGNQNPSLEQSSVEESSTEESPAETSTTPPTEEQNEEQQVLTEQPEEEEQQNNEQQAPIEQPEIQENTEQQITTENTTEQTNSTTQESQAETLSAE